MSQSVSSKQPQILMFFVIVPSVFSHDLYLGSSRMTLWSERPKGGRGFDMYTPNILPRQVQYFLSSCWGCNILFKALEDVWQYYTC